MSDIMDHAVIKAPFDIAMSDDISRYRFYTRAQGILSERDQLRAEVESLRQFADEVISWALAVGWFDGGGIQEMAVQHGLLRSEGRFEACGDECSCSEFSFPCECFSKTDLLLGAASTEQEV